MSLNIYLIGEEKEQECICPCCDNEHTRKVTDYWFDGNITHNLNTMADAAGIYEALWRPYELHKDYRSDKTYAYQEYRQFEEDHPMYARDIIDKLKEGLEKLKAAPDEYKIYNPSNGWGEYSNLVSFVEEYLEACINHPDARIHASR